MSKTIDERVVEMRFDNKQFESNVATSMSTLEKLKKSLKFDGASKGLEEINSAAGRVNMSGLGGAIDTVKAKFSAMDVIAITALTNITNKAINAGEQLVKSLSIDQVTAGWQKFSEKTTSVATLVAQGNAIEDVNAQLDRLNWFTDETSYNFTDMVSNIAKFTATGKGLEESVTAMEGIANWAALSGQNAATASRAMYQLSQAMGSGMMRKEDYKSIQNASMDTEEFRQKCIDAGIALGTLKDNGDGTFTSLKANVKDGAFTISQFADHLTEDAWLTSDVMMEVFNEYSSAVNAIYEVTEEKGMLASEVLDEVHSKAAEINDGTMSDTEAINAAIKELGYTASDGSLLFDAFGIKAFEAAQKARTFSDAIDSVKDAVSTGWMNTFELLFGNANQATALWTDVANQLWDIFAGGGETRNEILENTMVSGWDKLIERINKAGVETSTYEQAIRACAEAGGVDVNKLVKEYGSLSDAFANGAIDTKYLEEALGNLSNTVTNTTSKLSVDLSDITKTLKFGSVGDDVKKVQTALTELGFSLDKFGVDGIIGAETTAAIKAFQESVGLVANGIVDSETLAALEKAGTVIEEIGEAADGSAIEIDDLLDSISRPSGQELLFSTISNSLTGIATLVATVRDAWGEIFTVDRTSSGIYKVLSAMQSAAENFAESVEKNSDKLKSSLKGIIAIFDILTSIVGGALKAAFEILGEIFGSTGSSMLDLTANVGDVIVAFRDWLFENNLITKGFNKIVKAAKKVIAVIKNWITTISNIPSVRKVLDSISSIFDEFTKSADDMDGAIKKVEEWFEVFSESPEVQAMLEQLHEAFEWIREAVEASIENLSEWFEVFKQTEGVQQLITAVNNLISAFSKLFNGEIDANGFARSLGTNLAKALLSLPKIAKQVASDFIAGFQNGIVDSIGGIITNIVEFCLNFVSSFAEALGVESPSWKAYQIVCDFFQGAINAISDMISPVLAALEPVGEAIVKVFKSFWDYITDENGNVEWGKIIAGAITVESLLILKSFAEALDKFASAATSFSGVISGVTGVLSATKTAITNVGKAVKNDLNANALLKMATAIGILAASIWVLCQIDDYGKLGAAVLTIVILAGVIAGLAWAMDKLGSASIQFSAAKKSLNIDGLKTTILQLGIALLAMAVVVKLIGSMTPDEAKQGLTALAGMVVGMITLMAVLGGISRYSKSLSGFGGTMIAMAAAMALMVIVMKMVSGMDPSDIVIGLAVMEAFALLCIEIGIANRAAGAVNNGSSFTKMAVAMGLMVIVMKLIATMNPEDILVGIAVMQAFVILLAEMAIVNRIAGSNASKFGGTVAAMSFSMVLMAGVVKLLSGMDESAVDKGIATMQKFVLLIAELILVSKLAGKESAKIAGNLLAMSIAIGILAGIVVLLSMTEGFDLAKGLAVVAGLGLIMSTMIWATRGASNCKANLVTMTTAIAVMAACVVALSFIDGSKLAGATAAMGSLMLCFALMSKAAGSVQNTKGMIASLAAMIGVVIVLTGVIYLLGALDPTSAIPNTTALAILLLAFTAAMRILATGGSVSKSVSSSLAAMFAVAVGLGAILIAMSRWSNPSALISSAVAMSVLLISFTAALRILATGGSISKTVSAQIYPMLAVAAGLGLILVAMSRWSNPSALVPSAIALGILMNAFSVAMRILATGGSVSKSVSAQIYPMLAVAAGLGLILVAMSRWSNPSALVPSAIALGILMNAMAAALVIIKFAGKNAATAARAMVTMGLVLAEIAAVLIALSLFDVNPSIETALALSTLLLALSAACLVASLAPTAAAISGALGLAAFIGIMAGVVAAAGLLSKIPGFDELLADGGNTLGLVGTAIGNFVGGIVGGVAAGAAAILPDIGTSLSSFMEGAQSFISLAGNIDAGIIAGVGYLTAAILLISAADFIAGITQILSGGLSFAELGQQLLIFGLGATAFFAAIQGIDNSAVEAATNVSNMILALTASECISAITEKFGGSVDFSSMGENLKTFGEAIVEFSDTISGKIDVAAVEAAANAGSLIVELNKSLPRSGGWVQDIIGEQDLSAFATACGAFANCILYINEAISADGFEIQSDKIAQLVDAGTKFSDLNNALPRTGGVAQDLAGEQDLAAFGRSCAAFASCMIVISQSVSSDEFVVQSDKISQLITAGTQFNELNTALPKTGGVAQDLAGEQDLGRFGAAVAAFAGCMMLVNTALSQEGFSINLEGIEQLKQAGLKMEELQSVLPKSGGWWQSIAGESDIGDFGSKIKTFGTAIVDFSTSATGLDSSGMDLAIRTAERIKTFIESLADFDDTGLDNFEPVEIGKQMKKYANQVSSIDTDLVSSSISSANRLKTFISGLAELDTSGVSNFNVGAIGTSLKTYNSNVSSFNYSKVASSITAATQLKNFISSLAGLNTSGVSSFGSAIAELGAVNVNGFVDAFSSASGQMTSVGASMASAIATGINSGASTVTSAANSLLSKILSKVKGQSSAFRSAGSTLASNLASGIRSGTSSASSAGSAIASSGVSGARTQYYAMHSAGVYLGQGLIAGIKSMEQSVYNAAYKLGQKAVEGELDGQNSASPSKAMIKAGKWFGEGLIIGMERMGRSVYNAGENMGQSAVNATRSAMSTVLDVLNGDMDAQPTIRPVVDLSNVQTGAAAINSMFGGAQTMGIKTNMNAISVAMNGKLQNGTANDIISAINKLGDGLENNRGDTYNFGDFTYDDGSAVADAVGTLVRYARIGRRV